MHGIDHSLKFLLRQTDKAGDSLAKFLASAFLMLVVLLVRTLAK